MTVMKLGLSAETAMMLKSSSKPAQRSPQQAPVLPVYQTVHPRQPAAQNCNTGWWCCELQQGSGSVANNTSP